MEEEVSPLSARRIVSWSAVGLAVALLAAYLVNLFRFHQFSVVGAVIGLALGVSIIGAVATFGSSRAKALRRRFPHAFVSNVALYPQLHDQLRDACRALQLDPSMLSRRRSAAIVLDDEGLRMFAGARTTQILDIPVHAIDGLRTAVAPQGRWMLPSLEIDLGAPGGPLRLDLCLITERFGFPHAVGRAELEKRLAVARQAIGVAPDRMNE